MFVGAQISPKTVLTGFMATWFVATGRIANRHVSDHQ
jgi:hypothetical protein